MKKNYVYAQTQTKGNQKAMAKITSKQWKIYYYLLSISKYNTKGKEDHRYVYRDQVNISAVCRLLEIKSPQTFYNALERLKEKGLVIRTESCYYIYAKEPVKIETDVLLNLMSYSFTKNDDEIDLLRTYLILKKIDEIAGDAKERSFTARQICLLLGHSDTRPEYYINIKKYLGLLSFWGLIELKYHTATNLSLGNHYTVYHLQKIYSKATNPDFEFDIQEEMNAKFTSESLMEKLKEQFPWLMNE